MNIPEFIDSFYNVFAVNGNFCKFSLKFPETILKKIAVSGTFPEIYLMFDTNTDLNFLELFSQNPWTFPASPWHSEIS